MSSAELSARSGRPFTSAADRLRPLRVSPPQLVLWAVLGLILWSAFDHGAVDEAASARIEVGAALIALPAVVAWLWSGTLRLAVPRRALIGLSLLAAFCAWSAFSVLWSVDADRSWVEANRSLLYAVVLGLALAAGSSWRPAGERLTAGLEAVAGAVSLYAIGQKVLPGLHLAGINLDQTGAIPRLQEPLGYWNALALLLALAAPVVLLRATDPRRGAGARAGSLALLGLLGVTIAFTLSRGGLIVLFLGLAGFVAAGGRPLRSLLWAGLAIVGVAPAVVLGLSDSRLSSNDVALAARERAGLILLGLLALGLAVTAAAAWRVAGLERRVAPPPAARRRIWRTLTLLAAAVVIAGLIAVTVSGRGLTGTISHAWHSFTATHAASVTQPTRLLSADSANRWVWWKEAAGAFSDRPLAGWGTGSFPVIHLLYRRDSLSVNQPHSVPLQWLSETGLIGLLLAGGALLLLLAAGGQALRRASTVPERAARAALLAASVAYVVHALYDWDWDIPAVTLPFLLCLGVLAGAAGRRPPVHEAADRRPRAGWLILAALLLCAFAFSAVLPSIAATRAGDAVVAAASGSPAGLDAAAADAEAATSLDPLSDAGPRVAATIALRRGERRQARHELLVAVHRNPTDPAAWSSLAFIELQLGDTADANRAAQRARELDPLGVASTVEANLVAVGAVRAAPPRGSATAVRTP